MPIFRFTNLSSSLRILKKCDKLIKNRGFKFSFATPPDFFLIKRILIRKVNFFFCTRIYEILENSQYFRE